MSGSFNHGQAPRWQWWVVIFSGILTLACGTYGGINHVRESHPNEATTHSTILSAAYSSFQMLILHTPHYEGHVNIWLELGRWGGVVTLIATTWALFWSRLRYEFRLLRGWNKHYVICGLGHKGMAIVESIKQRDRHAGVVVIEPNPHHDHIDRCTAVGVSVIPKSPTNQRALKMARVGKAREIIAVVVEDEANIRIAAEVREFRNSPGTPHAYCRVHVASSYLPEPLQNWTDSRSDPHTTLRFFDVFDNEARRVLLDLPQERASLKPNPDFVPLDGDGIAPGDARSVHVVILGMGRMGSSLALRAAKIGHFANGKPIRISVIDRDVEQQSKQLFFRYPALAGHNGFCKLDLYPLHADSLGTRQLIKLFADDPDTLLHVFVCLDGDVNSLEIGVRLWDLLVAHPQAYMNIRIKSRSSIGPILQSSGARVQAFGMLEDTCTLETFLGERNEAIARSIHHDYAEARKQDPARNNDPALVADWDNLRDDYRESNRQQADHMAIKMGAIHCRIVEASDPGIAITTFSPEDVEMLADLEHRRWNAERWLSGWCYGSETDKLRRIHNCLVAWDKLPNEIKEFDREVVRKIPQWLANASPKLKVVRSVH